MSGLLSFVGWTETPGERLAKTQRTRERDVNRIVSGTGRESIPVLEKQRTALDVAIRKAQAAGDKRTAVRLIKQIQLIESKIKILDARADRGRAEIVHVMSRSETLDMAATARRKVAIDSAISADISPADAAALDYFASLQSDGIDLTNETLEELTAPSEEAEADTDRIYTDYLTSTLERLPSVPTSRIPSSVPAAPLR